MVKILFDPDKHEYKVNGAIKPSATQVIKELLFPHTYAYVKKEILERAATFGKNVHQALDMDFPEALSDEELNSYNEAVKLLNQWGFVPILKETKIYSSLGYAGTFDLYADMGENRYALIDYKTTSTLDQEYVSWQLSMYKVALEEMGKVVHGLYAIHIPRNKKGKLYNIPIKNKIEIEWLITQWNERKQNE